MRRRAVAILLAVSLMSCMAVIVLWADSYSNPFRTGLPEIQVGRVYMIASEAGEVRIYQYSRDPVTGTYVGFALTPSMVVPYYLPVALFALPPAMWIRSRWRSQRRMRQRLQRGLCVVCGHDLRASFGACPACGTPIPHARHA